METKYWETVCGFVYQSTYLNRLIAMLLSAELQQTHFLKNKKNNILAVEEENRVSKATGGVTCCVDAEGVTHEVPDCNLYSMELYFIIPQK